MIFQFLSISLSLPPHQLQTFLLFQIFQYHSERFVVIEKTKPTSSITKCIINERNGRKYFDALVVVSIDNNRHLMLVPKVNSIQA